MVWIDEEEESKKKLKIFLHVVEPSIVKSGIVSNIYLLEIDANIHKNSSLEFSDVKKPSSSSLPMIKPVFRFSRKVKFYPACMSCVRLGSKLYLMGGSLTYTAHLLKLSYYDMDFRGGKYENGLNEPIINVLEERLENYPPDVCVFDCNTCDLLPDDSCPPMNSGKYPNPLTFVANDQIFVLSTSKVHDDMITFESMKPGHGWKKLTPPPDMFFFRSNNQVGSALIKDKFLLTFSVRYGKIILSYDINSDKWTPRKTYHLPQLSVDSIFVRDTLYSAACFPVCHTYSPVLCFGPLKSTGDVDQDGANLDYVAFHRSEKESDFGQPISVCSEDIRNWPIDVNQFGHATRCLLHLGGLLKDTKNNSRFFGFVELFNPYPHEYEEADTRSELRFVAFKALSNKNSANIDAEFHVRTIHTSHFSTDLFGTGSLNAACAYLA